MDIQFMDGLAFMTAMSHVQQALPRGLAEELVTTQRATYPGNSIFIMVRDEADTKSAEALALSPLFRSANRF
jgi:hypothetical protein